jgi:hypothetical protein
MLKLDDSAGFRQAGFVGGVAAAILAAVIVGALYLGRDVFVPLALAILLSFVLAPSFGSCKAGACREASPSSALSFWRSSSFSASAG